MKHSAESVPSTYVKAGESVRRCQRCRQWLEGAGAGDALMRAVPVAEVLELPQGAQEGDWSQVKVRSGSSRRQV
jgi:hypothetical protein